MLENYWYIGINYWYYWYWTIIDRSLTRAEGKSWKIRVVIIILAEDMITGPSMIGKNLCV